MTEKEKIEFYKELYFREFDDRNHLNDAISLPISIISALLAGIFYLIINFSFKINLNGGIIFLNAETIFFLIPLSVCIALTFISIYYLILSYTSFKGNFDFKALPYAKELNDYNARLVKDSASKGEETFEKYLLEKYIEHTDHNTRVNDSRRFLFVRSKRMLIFAVIAIALSFIPFIKNHFEKTENITKVEITNFPE